LIIEFDLLYKNSQDEQLNSRRFPVFPEGISNSSRFSVFPGFPEVVDTLLLQMNKKLRCHRDCTMLRVTECFAKSSRSLKVIRNDTVK